MMRFSGVLLTLFILLFSNPASAALLRGKPAAAAFPQVLSQSIPFGANTKVNAGGYGPVIANAVPITSSSCTGTGRSDFNLSANGIFTPAVSPLSLPGYTFACTFGNAFGSSTPTITIGAETDVYSAATITEFLFLANSEPIGTIAGKTIKLRGPLDTRVSGYYIWPSGNGSGSPFRNRNPASVVRITSQDNNNRATFLIGQGVQTGLTTYLVNQSNTFWNQLKWYAPFCFEITIDPLCVKQNTSSEASGAAFLFSGTLSNVTFDDNEIYSNFKNIIDTYGFATLYGNSTNIGTSNTPETIGTGTKSFTLTTTGKLYRVNQMVSAAINDTHYMSGRVVSWVDPVITIDMTLAVSSGSSSSWTIEPEECSNSWANCLSWRGIFNVSGIGAGGVNFTNNVWHDASRIAVFGRALADPGLLFYSKNYVYNFAGDCAYFAGYHAGTEVTFNTCAYPLSLGADGNHRDGLQFEISSNPNNLGNVPDIKVVANRIISIPPIDYQSYPDIATDIQVNFMEGIQPKNYTNARSCLNFGLSSAVHGPALYNGDTSLQCGNVMVMPPAWSTNPSTYVTVLFRKSGTPTVTPSNDLSADNLAYGAGYDGQTSAWGVAQNNISGVDPQTDYSTYFNGCVGGGFAPTTPEEAVVCFTPKPGSAMLTATPKIGPVGTGYVDWVNKIWDYPRLNPVDAYSLTALMGQATSTVVQSNTVQVTNILKSNGAASAFGALVNAYVMPSDVIGTPEFRIASDAGCTVPVVDWTSTPAIATAGQYVCWRAKTAATAATARPITTWIGGNRIVWTITTS